MGYEIGPGTGLVVVKYTNSATGNVDSVRFAVSLTNQSTFSQSEFNALANIFRDNLKLVVDSAWSIGPCNIIYSDAGVLKVYVDPTTEPGVGTAAVYSPDNCSCIVTKRTAFLGVRNRGRVYFPPIPETLVDEGGVVDATFRSDVQGVMNTLLSAVNAATGIDNMILLHSEGVAGVPPDVTSLQVQAVIGTQRKRIRR